MKETESLLKFQEKPEIKAQKQAIESLLAKSDRELGKGFEARVVTREEDSFCIKNFKAGIVGIKSKQELFREFVIQERLHRAGVQVPRLLSHHYFPENQEYYIYMEKIEGFSLDRYIDGEIDLLETFNPDSFWEDVKNQIQAMHSNGILHGDLHVGNIMIDDKTGKACIIDFGRSREISAGGTEGELSEVVTSEDWEGFEKIKKEFQEWYESLR